MWLAKVVGSIPFKARLLGTLVVLVGLLLLSGPVIFNHTGFFLVLIFLLFFDRIIARTEHREVYVDDPINHIQLQDGVLHVAQHRIDASLVQRVALGSSGRRGYLQFPFNPKFAARLSFPTEQVDAVSQHLKQLLPDVVIVE